MSPFSLDTFHERYQTDTKDLRISSQRFQFFVPQSIDPFVDPKDILSDFPLWAKIWEAAIVLADHLAAMSPDPEKRFLDIGGGMGLVAIVAACFGHRLTMMEYNADAVRFARANAEANPCTGRGEITIAQLDWRQPALKQAFDYIVGSEVVYNEQDYDPLLRLFTTCLRPGGTIILAERLRKTSIEFFRQMSARFDITARKKVLRPEGEEVRVILATMTLKVPEVG